MNNETMQAYTEINCILSKMPQFFVQKVPLKLREFFEKYSDKNYNFIYDDNKTVGEQKLKDETLAILAILRCNYWSRNIEEKNKYINKLKNNEIKYQNELKEKYNPDDLFKNRNMNTQEKNNSNQIIILNQDSILDKILNKIRRIYRVIKNKFKI